MLPSYGEIVGKSLTTGLAQANMFVITLVNSMVVGRARAADGAEQLSIQAGLGLAIAMQSVVVFGPGSGMAGACDTIVSQATGAGDMLSCALCLGQLRTLLTLHWLVLVLPIALIYQPLLLAVGFDPSASRYAGLYLRIVLPGMFFRCQTVLLRRFLACVNQPWITPWATTLSSLVHVCLLASLGFWVSIDVLALVTNVSYTVPSLFLMGYLLFRPEKFGLQRWWLLRYAFVFHGLRTPFCLGLSNSVQSIAEELAMQSFTLMSVRLGNTAVAASSVCFNICGSIYAFGIGSGATAAGLVGAAIGRGHAHAARRTAWRCGAVAGFLGCPFLIGLLIGAEPMSERFSQQKAFIAEEAPLLRLLGLSQCLEIVSVTWCSILRAANRPKVGPTLIVCFYYAVMIPLAWVLAFPAELGTFGMWLSYTLGCVTVCAILADSVRRTSFEAEARVRLGSQA